MGGAPRGKPMPHPQSVQGGNTQPYPTFFAFALALNIAVTLGRLHEVIGILGRLYLGKLSTLMLLAAFFIDGSKLPIAAAMKTTTAKCIGLISVLAILSIPGSYWPGYSVGILKNVWPLITLVGVGVLFGFSNRRIAYLSIVTVTIVGGIGAGELLLGGGWSTVTNLSEGVDGPSVTRAYIGGGGSTTYDPNYSAAFFCMLIPYAIMLASRKGWLRWVGLGLVPILAAAMIKTGSRGGVIALLVLAVCIPIFAEKKQRKMQITMLVAGIGAVMLAPHSDLMARMAALTSGSDYNLSGGGGRWDVWATGIGLMFTHPLVGVGMGAFPVADAAVSGRYVDAHNTYVQIAAELGILGIGSLVVMMVTAYKSIQRSRRSLRAMAQAGDTSDEVALDTALATAALCSLIAELTAATFLSMAYESMTMFALTVPIALAMTRRSPVQVRATMSQGAARIRRQFAPRPAAVPRGLALPPRT